MLILKLNKNIFNEENVHDQWQYKVLFLILLIWTLVSPDYFWKYSAVRFKLLLQGLLIILLTESSKQQIYMMTMIE